MDQVKIPTIQDVARVAGVSTATVSRTLTRPEVVSKATKKAVEAAIAETGYTVNHAARNLRQQRVGGIVALVPNLANPFFSQILAGIASILRPEGMNLLIADTQTGPEGGLGILDYADRSRTDGLIVLDGSVPAAVLRDGRGRKTPPLVLACEWIEGLNAPRIMVDNALGARMAVRHLADLGHKRIGHLLGPRGNILTETRWRGFQVAMREKGLELREDWCLDEGDFSLDSGKLAARAFLMMKDRPTAMFCASDEMACGFIGELQRNGVRVPRDVSIVGFDNIELGAHITPALTTIRQPRMMIGEAAAKMLLRLISGDLPAEQAEDVVLPLEMILRDSTAMPRN